MRVIKQMADLIEKSLDAADCYIQKSIKWKADHPALSRALYEASLDEMDNVTRFHDEIAKLIQEYRAKNGEPPEAMKAVYDYLHEKHISRASGIKGLQTMYKGS